jgi:hypothetical protein
MTTFRAVQSIYDDATGANGELTRSEIIDRASNTLVDYVHETLTSEYGITYGQPVDSKVLHVVGRLVARAMLDQHNHTEDINNGAIAAVLERMGEGVE